MRRLKAIWHILRGHGVIYGMEIEGGVRVMNLNPTLVADSFFLNGRVEQAERKSA